MGIGKGPEPAQYRPQQPDRRSESESQGERNRGMGGYFQPVSAMDATRRVQSTLNGTIVLRAKRVRAYLESGIGNAIHPGTGKSLDIVMLSSRRYHISTRYAGWARLLTIRRT